MLLGLAYILIRNFTVGATYDEIWTINDFVTESYMHILNYQNVHTNNHLLNTLLIKFLFSIFEESIYVARLPNTLSSLLFLYFGLKFCSSKIGGWAGVFGFGLLITNPFLMDFLSLARGYGLSLSFMITSLYFLFTYMDDGNFKNILKANLYSGLAALSSFALLNYWIVALFITIVFYFRDSERIKKVNLVYLFLIVAGVVGLLYEPIRKMMKYGGLQFGGSRDFYHDTLVSLTFSSMYALEASSATYVVLAIAISVFILSVIMVRKSSWKKWSTLSILLIVLSLCILSTIVQHYLLGTKYLLDRTGLFYLPLFALSLAIVLRECHRKYASLMILFVGGLMSLNMALHGNTYKTALWFFDSCTKDALEEANQIGRIQDAKMRLAYAWPYGYSLNYHYRDVDGNINYPYVEIIYNINDSNLVRNGSEMYLHLDRELPSSDYYPDEQIVLNKPLDTLAQYPLEYYPGAYSILFALRMEDDTSAAKRNTEPQYFISL